MTTEPGYVRIGSGALADAVFERVSQGARLAAMFASARQDGSTVIRALLARAGSVEVLEAELLPGAASYPAVTVLVPAADWYEREMHDLFGVEPVGHPHLDPLVLPLDPEETWRPRPGASAPAPSPRPRLDVSAPASRVAGQGLFTIAYGPVRSGVFESVEYLVETFGEDIPYLEPRVHYKHRGVERRFDGLSLDDGVLLAERVEGPACVAHSLAYCQAIEALAQLEIPRRAALVRVVHAELERIAGHLDSVARNSEAAGQSVAYARITLHKERVQRLRAELCGHRFGRGVVVPGGVAGPLSVDPRQVLGSLARLEHSVADDTGSLMDTPSFLDRLRHTGVIAPSLAAAHGALGPVGRASGQPGDVRSERPYASYATLGFTAAEPLSEGDALARQKVRLRELTAAFHLVREALDELDEEEPGTAWHLAVPVSDGMGLGWVEAPQGELIYAVEVSRGLLTRVKQRSASFHNLALFPGAFGGDILTDFAFIEASFGFSLAGVSG